MHFLSTFHILHLSCLLCQLILFQYSLFLSVHHFYCFSVVPFSFHLPPRLSCHSVSLLSCSHTLCTALFFLLALPPPYTLNLHILFFLFPPLFSAFIHPLILHSHFGCIARGGVADACLLGFWGAAGVCNDHGKTYALYAITVFRRNQDGSEDCWKTYRRYSDFHDFHMRITEQVCVSSDVFIAAFQMSTPSLSWKEHNISVKTWSNKS